MEETSAPLSGETGGGDLNVLSTAIIEAFARIQQFFGTEVLTGSVEIIEQALPKVLAQMDASEKQAHVLATIAGTNFEEALAARVLSSPLFDDPSPDVLAAWCIAFGRPAVRLLRLVPLEVASATFGLLVRVAPPGWVGFADAAICWITSVHSESQLALWRNTWQVVDPLRRDYIRLVWNRFRCDQWRALADCGQAVGAAPPIPDLLTSLLGEAYKRERLLDRAWGPQLRSIFAAKLDEAVDQLLQDPEVESSLRLSVHLFRYCATGMLESESLYRELLQPVGGVGMPSLSLDIIDLCNSNEPQSGKSVDFVLAIRFFGRNGASLHRYVACKMLAEIQLGVRGDIVAPLGSDFADDVVYLLWERGGRPIWLPTYIMRGLDARGVWSTARQFGRDFVQLVDELLGGDFGGQLRDSVAYEKAQVLEEMRLRFGSVKCGVVILTATDPA